MTQDANDVAAASRAIRDMAETSAERNAQADLLYGTLTRTGIYGTGAFVLTYRCQESRCSLLHVIEAVNGFIVGFPRYKLSPELNERTSSPAGRQRNTEDGWRRWSQRAGYLEYVSNPMLQCDHVTTTLDDGILHRHIDARHTEVIVRRDGSTFAR